MGARRVVCALINRAGPTSTCCSRRRSISRSRRRRRPSARCSRTMRRGDVVASPQPAPRRGRSVSRPWCTATANRALPAGRADRGDRPSAGRHASARSCAATKVDGAPRHGDPGGGPRDRVRSPTRRRCRKVERLFQVGARFSVGGQRPAMRAARSPSALGRGGGAVRGLHAACRSCFRWRSATRRCPPGYRVGADHARRRAASLWFATRRATARLQMRDGFLLVALVWTRCRRLRAAAALPHSLGLSFTDAYFEAVSGLTASGGNGARSGSTAAASINIWARIHDLARRDGRHRPRGRESRRCLASAAADLQGRDAGADEGYQADAAHRRNRQGAVARVLRASPVAVPALPTGGRA